LSKKNIINKKLKDIKGDEDKDSKENKPDLKDSKCIKSID